MNGFWGDVRHALRMLLKNPGFALTAIVTLALGIGANSAMFTVVNSVLLRPLPYPDSDRLVYLNPTSPATAGTLSPMSPLVFSDLRAQSDAFESMSASRSGNMNFSDGEQAERVETSRVSANTLRMLGLKPYLGRDFAEGEDAPGAAPVAMLSYSFWQSHFGGRADVIGRAIGLDGARHTVIGILPPGTNFPNDYIRVWIPYFPSPAENTRTNAILLVYARLKAGNSFSTADAQVKAIAARMSREYPAELGNGSLELVTMQERFVGNTRVALWVLFGAVGCVLLIACANLANLLLARAAGRRSEMAVRTALGADRGRLARQLLTESSILSFLGAGLGLALAAVGVRALVALAGTTIPGIPGAAIPRAAEIQVDAPVLIFTLLVAAVTGILFGLFPALQLSGVSLAGALREGGRKGGTRGAAYRRALGVLVAAEVALSLMLLATAGLMLRSFAQLQGVSGGFSTENLLTFEMGASRASYPSNEKQAEFYMRVAERVRNLPGVKSAAAIHRLPLIGFASTGYAVEGRPAAPGAPNPQAEIRAVTPVYFQTMGIALPQGRDFTERDGAGSPLVAIVSESLAAREWPGESAVGKRIRLGGVNGNWWEIIGVAGDVKLRGFDRQAPETIYWTMPQQSFPNWLRAAYLVVRTHGEPAGAAPAIRAAVREIDPDQGLGRARTMASIVESSLGKR